MAPDPFNLSTLSAALLPRKTSASVNLLLAVADMKRGDLRAFRRNVESAVRCYSDAAPSIRFSTLSGRGLTLLSDALGTGRVAFVRALLLDYRVDWNVPVDSGGDALKRAFESKEQFATLIAGEFELRLTPRTLEEYVAERRPELTALLRARRAETTRGRKLCETVSYESTSTERCAPVGDDSSSEVRPRAEEAMRVQEFAFRVEEDSAAAVLAYEGAIGLRAELGTLRTPEGAQILLALAVRHRSEGQLEKMVAVLQRGLDIFREVGALGPAEEVD